MGLFGKKKSDKHAVILMMDCDMSGALRRIMEDMTEANREYAMDGVRLNFVSLIYGKRLKQYRTENVKSLFPNHWDAPLFREDVPGMEKTAEDCARDFIRKNLPGVDPEQTVISVDPFPGKPYAGIFFEY